MEMMGNSETKFLMMLTKKISHNFVCSSLLSFSDFPDDFNMKDLD
jgi:hypothetical protein